MTSGPNAISTAGAQLFLQCVGQEIDRALPGISSIIRAIPLLVIRILEGVTGVGIDNDLDSLAQLLHGLFELLDIIYRDPAILTAEDAEYRCIDFLQLLGICSEMAVINNVRREGWLLEREVE